MHLKGNPPKPCPYDLPPAPQLGPESLKKLDPWNALKFFHVEALLRSEAVWDLYRKASRRKGNSDPQVRSLELWLFLFGGDKPKLKLRGKASAAMRRLLGDGTLRYRFSVDDGWAVLLGSHHRFLTSCLCAPSPLFWISEGILDLAALHRSPDLYFDLKYLQEEQSRYLYLRIDGAVAPYGNIGALEPVLRKRYEALSLPVEKPTIDPRTGVCTHPFHPRKHPRIKDAHTWLEYFQCYDRRQSGLKPKEIAERVYPNDINALDKAKLGIRRVGKLIQAAEQNDWPPPNLQ